MTDHDLSRRKILGGIVTIGAAGAAAGAGTMAYFSDTESSTNNTIQAGTLDLSDGVASTSITTTALAPGKSVQQTFTLENNGNIPGNHVEIDVSATENDGTNPSGYPTDIGTMDYALSLGVPTLTYDGSSLSQADLPGAFINSVDDTNDSSDEARITSNGQSVIDYNLISIDVSSHGKTINDLDGGTLSYDWKASGVNTANAPDEVFLSLSDGSTIFKSKSSSTTGSYVTRNVDSEFSGTWYNLDLNQVDPVSDKGGETVENVAVGVGDFDAPGNPGNARVFDVYLDQLDYDGTTYSLAPSSADTWVNPQPNLQDLRSHPDGVTLPSRAAPGTSGSIDFVVEFQLDADVGNAYQADGVDVTFDFGLAQTSGQDVL